MAYFIRRPVSHEIVDAELMVSGAQSHPQGVRPPKPGEWIVTNPTDGSIRVMSGEEFNALYEPLSVPGNVVPQPEPELFGVGPMPERPEPITEQTNEPPTPMNEAVPGRPSPTPEVKPRMTDPPGPVESPSGQPEEPGSPLDHPLGPNDQPLMPGEPVTLEREGQPEVPA